MIVAFSVRNIFNYIFMVDFASIGDNKFPLTSIVAFMLSFALYFNTKLAVFNEEDKSRTIMLFSKIFRYFSLILTIITTIRCLAVFQLILVGLMTEAAALTVLIISLEIAALVFSTKTYSFFSNSRTKKGIIK
jgi:hypothetical protein